MEGGHHFLYGERLNFDGDGGPFGEETGLEFSMVL